MALFERMNRESLEKREQEAFGELTDTLVFGSPQHFRISRGNISEYSRLVQDTFRTQDERQEGEKQLFMHELISSALSSLKATRDEIAAQRKGASPAAIQREPRVDTDSKKASMPEEKTVTEEFLSSTKMYLSRHGRLYWQDHRYGAWGFTPMLADSKTEEYERPYERDGKNCFGVVQALGARFREMGLPYQMGITADHPFAIVEVEGKTYFASLYGVHEAKGKFQQADGFKTYAPSEEDELPYRIMLVWDFDEALLYEQLENFEILRQMSLGNEVENLPGTKESGMKIAEQHRGTLQGANWRTLQQKLVPKLAAYFRDHAEEWNVEIERMHLDRELTHTYNEIMTAAQQATSFKGRSYDDFLKEFLPVAKQHSDAISHYLMKGIEMPIDASEDVRSFAREVKGMMDTVAHPQLKEQLIKAFLRPFRQSELEIVSEERLTGE